MTAIDRLLWILDRTDGLNDDIENALAEARREVALTTRDDQMTTHREALKATYRTWANDFLTITKFANWLRVSDDDAALLVDMGRKYQKADSEKVL